MKPIADYVVRRMGNLGIKRALVMFAKDNAMMISYLRQGKVDWITETPFSAGVFVEKGEAEIILRRWNGGVPEYHTVFFARRDSPINSLRDLKGRTIAFEDPGSTSAFLLPAATLIQHGLPLVRLTTPREKPPADMVGYIFASSEVNAPAWVFRGHVDAGAFSNLDWNDDGRMLPSLKKDMRIFFRTKAIDRGLELVRRDLDPAVKNRLKQILLNAHNDPSARAALKAYKMTTRFDEPDADMARRMDWIKSLSAIIQESLN
ncbi:MAG: phosphate/phosphite/phosphonate ABC transporter substrate-binding protein [Desulfobacterales bacterium]|nr:phosphate/phosphite/phosphonate ABC transporter substrate-binding protein [Desulfobacterales bacterium]